ncbi:MAG: hypothetical protein ACKVPX_14785 [Myxococcaceae bacterium]
MKEMKPDFLRVTLDRTSPTFEADLAAFVRRANTQSLQAGGDTPLCAVREEGDLLHLEAIPASSTPGGQPAAEQDIDGYKKPSKVPVDLNAPTNAEQPPTSTTLAADVKALLRKFRG